MATQVGLTQRTAHSPYGKPDYEDPKNEEDTKGHPPPAKEVGKGMLLGMGIAALVIIIFVLYIEEEKWAPDWAFHAKVVEHHKKHKESHAHLTRILNDIKGKAERGELPHHEPTEEELEAARFHKNMRAWEDNHWDHHPDAPGMIDALGNQMRDTKHDLESRLKEFWRLDKDKNAFLTESDFAHLVKRPSNLDEESFKKLDKNGDGAIGIREYCKGFHDQAHVKEPWYHHKYGYVYGHDIPNHIKHAKVGAVKKGTAEHAAMKAGVHPAQVERKIADAKKDKEMKELNEKAHAEKEQEHEREDKEHAQKAKAKPEEKKKAEKKA